jgi:thioredoxin 1
MTNTLVLHLDSSNFDKEISSHQGLALVDFWAEWCGPCKRIAPVIDQLAQENAGKLKVAKVDVDNNPDLAGRYGIQSIPSLLFFKNGKLVDQILGAVPKSEIQNKINKLA